MATVVATIDFTYGANSFQHQKTYDTAVDWVAAAYAAVPQLFTDSGGTKIANTSGVFRDSRGGGFDRVFRVGENYPSNDPVVTACPTAFV